jgi:hypothetical protein
VPLSVAIFLIASPIYLVPGYAARTLESLPPDAPGDWDYMGYGAVPPWWFPFAVFAVKVTPWWTAALIFLIPAAWGRLKEPRVRLVSSVVASTAVLLLMKSVLFGREVPHQQYPVYPLIYLAIAFSISEAYRLGSMRTLRMALALAVAAAILMQLTDLYAFFPNLLFYGSQYGTRFVGEFWGPAVFQCQGLDSVKEVIAGLKGRIIAPPGSCLTYLRTSKRYVDFPPENPEKEYPWAYTDLRYQIMRPPYSGDYLSYLQKHNCSKRFVMDFPQGIEAYAIYECGAADSCDNCSLTKIGPKLG